ncbi:MAG TPA: type 1 glutamine amidotransferase [Acidimicrobiales bacterium]|nr:type 1 glutamine amidotransferase [Acidimicrobiales bacterium]
MASCLVVQHVEPEGPYAIGDALDAAGVEIDLRRVFAGDRLPSDVSDHDGLVMMGGPMSAAGDAGFATRRAELALLVDALDRGTPTLGVCLGAQLLALAGGGAVSSGDAGPEIGWAPVDLTDSAGDDPLLGPLPPRLSVLHWHGDTFDPPPGAVLLATSTRYRGQAFRVGSRAWGLQFHLEVDERAVAAFLDAFGADALSAGTTPEAIALDTAAALATLGPHRTRVLARFAGLVAAHDRSRLADLA